jgi:hypothetical protein
MSPFADTFFAFCSDMGPYKSHGTNDVTGFGEEHVTAARKLLLMWNDDPEGLAEDALYPFENAENIAAAATGKSLVELDFFRMEYEDCY